ncbi:callose synthase 11-like [Dorcoceras hygrometricum]|uniref:Callose synthase 11-like n=1 Tax=Dorcoceras hygrometricum TaxID=472368 RepID=A0A2Z7ABH7_9LAMI|nr:callose synthase 11-like [Dorcoceras hygrometricum]
MMVFRKISPRAQYTSRFQTLFENAFKWAHYYDIGLIRFRYLPTAVDVGIEKVTVDRYHNSEVQQELYDTVNKRRKMSTDMCQPWTAMASQIIALLSVAHSKSLEDLLAQQKEHGIITDRPSSSQLFKDLADNSGAILAQFYSMAKSKCWVRPMILVNGVWTPIQGNDFWRSSCRLSLFVNRRQVPESVVDTEFVPHGLFIEHVQYWGADPSLIKTWGWARVCSEIVRYSMFGCLSPRMDNSQSDILSRLHTVERGLRDTLGQQNEYFRNLIQSARQDGQNQDDIQTLRFNEYKKVVLAQGVTAGADSVEVRKEIKALDAKINSLDGLGEGSSSHLPLPPPVNQGEGSGNRTGGDTIRTTEIAQRDIENAQRDILERLMADDRQRERERDSGSETVGLSNQLFGLSGQIVTVGSVFRVMVAANRLRNCTKDSIGYPRTRASDESSTTKHRLLHASRPHPIPPPDDPNRVGKRVKMSTLVNGTVAGDRWIERAGFVVLNAGDCSRVEIC